MGDDFGMVINMTKEINNDLFNAKVKEDYLSEMVENHSISEATVTSYRRIFTITAEYENALKKDLNQFNFQEVETILYGFNSKHKNTVEGYARIISSYLKWSVRKGLTNENVLQDLKPTDFEKYVTEAEEYITEKQLRRYEDLTENYQDSALLRLYFLGVGGKNLSEIRYFEKTDIDFNNKILRLKNVFEEGNSDNDFEPIKFTERYLPVDDRTLYLLKGAMNQKVYMKKNGNISHLKNNVKPYMDLVDNKYVFRPSISNLQNWRSPIKKHVLFTRINQLAENLGIDYLTSKFLQRSGMIYYASQLVKDGVLSYQDRQMVAEHYNVKSATNLRGFLTIENIIKTYPQVVEGDDKVE